jgi:transcriptional regulator
MRDRYSRSAGEQCRADRRARNRKASCSCAQQCPETDQDTHQGGLSRANARNLALQDRLSSLPGRQRVRRAKQPLLGGDAGTLRTGQHITGFLGVRRNQALVYLATVQSEGPVAITHRPGSQTYLHSTAMGKALLAEMQNDKIRVLLGTRPLPRLTPRTTVTLPQLIKEIETVRRLGYATARKKTGKASFLPARWCAM